jgi:hypothetical protein
MNETQKYLSKVRSQARQQYNNADGAGWRNMYGTGTLANTPGSRGMRPNNWSANGSSTAMPAAPQYIIQISNSSASDVLGFDVFGASQYLFGNFGGGTWSNNGSFTINGVTITSTFSTVSYQQILTSSMSDPFTVGLVYLQTISGNPNQTSDVYTLTSQNASGELYSSPIKPYIDPYQFQNGITCNNQSFNVQALTKLTWTKIYASAVFQLTFFPANVIAPAQALNGNSVQNGYSKPRVVGSLQ